MAASLLTATVHSVAVLACDGAEPVEGCCKEDWTGRLVVMNKFDAVEAGDPVALFQAWFELAKKDEVNDPNAMSLATATAERRPSVRMVLLKHVDGCGFTFYTNVQSQKGAELLANPFAAALLPLEERTAAGAGRRCGGGGFGCGFGRLLS